MTYGFVLQDWRSLTINVTAAFASRVYVRKGTCADGEVVACGTNSFNTGVLEPGTYYLVVDSDGNLHKGDFTLNVSPSPLLIARGSHPYRRILVAVSGSPSSWRGLELAVDIARLLGSQIFAVHVAPPVFIGGFRAQEDSARVAERVEQLGRLYEVPLKFALIVGNPIKRVLALCAQSQLLVVAREHNEPDSYIEPDVGLRMALGARCSALLLSWD